MSYSARDVVLNKVNLSCNRSIIFTLSHNHLSHKNARYPLSLHRVHLPSQETPPQYPSTHDKVQAATPTNAVEHVGKESGAWMTLILLIRETRGSVQ
ncbi:predicted protein [Plenodomus lingam JN3]|uniref:Predicted protein n=1 Tax=Leptosphaeria maculans (strain JN3 / isolate v23.1.3 / race Av1-4-5-6-7-8) TaxID=985895 RepID=E5A2A0_LEPMJ|nr:predicted protein [Plenodomus lingam JN3]CBX97535.1 predicted protein [Plenodomus lingam JN3]